MECELPIYWYLYGWRGVGGGHSYAIFNDHIETLLFHNMFVFVLVQMASLASVAGAD